MKLVRMLRYRGLLLKIYHNGAPKKGRPYEWVIGHRGDHNRALLEAFPFPGKHKRIIDPAAHKTIADALRLGKQSINNLLDAYTK